MAKNVTVIISTNLEITIIYHDLLPQLVLTAETLCAGHFKGERVVTGLLQGIC